MNEGMLGYNSFFCGDRHHWKHTFSSVDIPLCVGLLVGYLLDFISFPVLKAFSVSCAITIGMSQVKVM